MFELVFKMLQAARLRRATHADIADDRCVACDSTDVEELGPDAYRCRACGYEGGSGLARMIEQQRRAAFDRMGPEQRRKSARKDLDDARTFLMAAIGTLDGAHSAGVHDLIGLGGQRGSGEGIDEKQALMTNAMADVERARALIRDADHKLKNRDGMPAGSNVDFVRWSLDIHLDNPLMDLGMLSTISQLRGDAAGLLAQVERALERM